MAKVSSILSKIKEDQKHAEFLKTGFPTLDKQLDGGFQRKQLVIVGASTGVGKSYLAGQIAFTIAKQGFKVGYFSLEISNEMIVSRLSGALANIKSARIRYAALDIKEYKQKLEAEAELVAYEDYIEFYDDIYSLDQILKLIKENEFEFCVIDFIQNVDIKGNNEKHEKLAKIALALQKAAKEYNCCILALSQLSNSVAREDIENKSLEYKGSGDIATVCDYGFFLQRDPYIQGSVYQAVTLKLKKNRHGVSDIYFKLSFKHPGGMLMEVPNE